MSFSVTAFGPAPCASRPRFAIQSCLAAVPDRAMRCERQPLGFVVPLACAPTCPGWAPPEGRGVRSRSLAEAACRWSLARCLPPPCKDRGQGVSVREPHTVDADRSTPERPVETGDDDGQARPDRSHRACRRYRGTRRQSCAYWTRTDWRAWCVAPLRSRWHPD